MRRLQLNEARKNFALHLSARFHSRDGNLGGMITCWRIDLTGDKLKPVGIIKAKTAEQAIDKSAKLFRMAPTSRDKLVATELQTRTE